MNLFEKFDTIVTDDFIKNVKTHLNDNLGNYEIAIKGIFYTLVAGLIRRSNSDMSAGMLYNQIQGKYKTGEITGDISELITRKPELDKLLANGTKVISQIFPAFKSPLLSMISTYAGTSKENTVFFSGLTASILIDMLGEKIKQEKMDKSDLVFFLQQHHEPLFKSAPDSLMEKMIPALGLQELTLMKVSSVKKQDKHEGVINSESTNSESYLDDEDDSSGFDFNKKIILGLVLVALIGAISYYLYSNNYFESMFSKDNTPVEAIEEEIGYDSTFVAGAALDSLKKDSIKVAQGLNSGDIDGFEAYVDDASQAVGKEFEFKSITYKEEGFDLEEASLPIISRISQKMATSKKLQIKVIGYSNSGDMKLNNKRAFAIKRVLISQGIESLRIDASSGGKGDGYPKIKVITK